MPTLLLLEECAEGSNPNLEETTLLQWISSKDNQSDLERVSEQCACRLEQV